MSIHERTARTVVTLLVSAGALSLTAAAFAAGGAAGSSPGSAGDGSLGLGTIRTAPAVSLTAAEKMGTSEQLPADAMPALVSVRQRAMTEIPAPKPKTVAKKRTVTPTNGWHTSRVTWYGPGFYGRHMASGMVLTTKSMVVAHRTLPFGTKIEFSYRGRTCIATVQDRGPGSHAFEFDLAGAVAQYLHFSGSGYMQWRYVR